MVLAPERRAFLAFVLCRLLGVVLRPLTLLVALRLPDGDFARDYSLLLTAITSSFVIYGNQNHRQVYTYFIGDTARRKGLGGTRAVMRYLDGVGVHMALFAPLVAAVVWIWVEDLWIWALILPLVVIEKYYDDQQRVLIYQRRYGMWCRHFICRTILPSGAILAAVVIWGWGNIAFYAALCVAFWVLYAVWISPQFTRIVAAWARRVVMQGGRALIGRVTTYLSEYVREYFGAQLFSILAVNLLILDRFFVKSDFTPQFAAYVFAVNVFAVVPLIHNMFHFTRIRPQLIDVNRPVMPTVLAPRNIGLPVVLVLGACASFPIMDRMSIVDLPVPYPVLAGLALIYTLAAISFVLQEFVFWRVRRSWLVAMDAILFAAAFGLLGTGVSDLAVIPFYMSGLLALRAAGMALLSASQHPRIRLPQSEGPSIQ